MTKSKLIFWQWIVSRWETKISSLQRFYNTDPSSPATPVPYNARLFSWMYTSFLHAGILIQFSLVAAPRMNLAGLIVYGDCLANTEYNAEALDLPLSDRAYLLKFMLHNWILIGCIFLVMEPCRDRPWGQLKLEKLGTKELHKLLSYNSRLPWCFLFTMYFLISFSPYCRFRLLHQSYWNVIWAN